jgi:hypothetical protein
MDVDFGNDEGCLEIKVKISLGTRKGAFRTEVTTKCGLQLDSLGL